MTSSKRSSEPILCADRPEEDCSDYWWKGPGWYWPDETWGLCGPHETKEEASAAQLYYAVNVLGA